MASKLPVVISHRNGKEYIKSKPLQVRQTERSRAAAARFGRSSRLVAALVRCFSPVIPVVKGFEVYRRMFAAFRSWQQLKEAHLEEPNLERRFFHDLRFTPAAGVFNLVKIHWDIVYEAEKVTVTLPVICPARDILAPPGCERLRLKIVAASCRPATGDYPLAAQHMLEIPYNNELQAERRIELSLPSGNENLVLVAFAVEYNNIPWIEAVRPEHRSWMPAGIVGSYYQI